MLEVKRTDEITGEIMDQAGHWHEDWDAFYAARADMADRDDEWHDLRDTDNWAEEMAIASEVGI